MKKCKKCNQMMEHFERMGWVFQRGGEDIFVCENCGEVYTCSLKTVSTKSEGKQ